MGFPDMCPGIGSGRRPHPFGRHGSRVLLSSGTGVGLYAMPNVLSMRCGLM